MFFNDALVQFILMHDVLSKSHRFVLTCQMQGCDYVLVYYWGGGVVHTYAKYLKICGSFVVGSKCT